MHQRTRVIRRNVRNVLILVDGHSTVADISLKTGNPQLTESALLELEKGGFVELQTDEDSIWAESKQVAQEIRDSAISKASPVSPPLLTPSPQENAEPVVIQPFIPSQLSNFSLTPFSILPNQTGQEAAEAIALPTSSQPPPKEVKTPARKSLKKVYLSSPALLKRFRSLVPNSTKKAEDLYSLKPIRRGRWSAIGWPMMVLITAVGLVALAYLSITFFPYKAYLPEVEQALSQASGKPAKVGTISVSLYPKPGLFLGDVRIGTGNDELRIADIRVLPELSTLGSGKFVLREVVLSGANFSAEQIATLPGLFVATSAPSSRFGLKHLRLDKSELSFKGLGLSAMEGGVILSESGLFQSLQLRTPDQSLTLEIKTAAQRLEISLDGYAWRPVSGSPFVFDSASIKGDIQNGQLTIRNFELRIFEGLIQGVAILQGEKKPAIAGDISFERVNAKRFGEALGLGQQFAGEVNGKIRFSMTADSWSGLIPQINAEGEFGIRRGSIRGIDLAEAVRRVSGEPVQGGVTVFEQLTGKLRLSPVSYQFSNLVMNSGLMQSTGNVDLSKELTLNGRIDLQMRGTFNQSRLPITLSGTLKAPVVQLGRR